MSRAVNVSLVIAFAATLLGPTVASLAHWNPMGNLDEKRTLAQRPTESLGSPDSLRRLPEIAQGWEKYFNDNFGLRKLLIGCYRQAAFHLLGMSPNPAVVVGASDGRSRWLFYDAEFAHDGRGFADMLGQKPYSQAELATIATRLRQVADLARSRGIALVIAVVPDKQTVYPEYLPGDKRPKPGRPSRLDQFWAMASSLDQVPLLDLRIPLRAGKTRVLYYPTDTHWNWRGAVIGFEAVERALAGQRPSRGLPPMGKISWSLGPPRIGDLSNLLGLNLPGDEDWLADPTGLASPTRPKQGKLLLIADSFFDAMPLYFRQDFETVKLVHRWTFASSGPLIEPELLDAEKPDAVVLESVERYWTN
jgi:alginate O-acetyltransferase complex protein AlgJ